MMTSKTNFRRTADWLAACGKEPGNPAHLSTQIGCHLEEISELLHEVSLLGPTGLSSVALSAVAVVLAAIANNLKAGTITAAIYDREAALDALCDCEVTGNGVAFLAGFNKDEADRRVCASNESKLDTDGKPVILPGGKIGKSPHYSPPDLTGLY